MLELLLLAAAVTVKTCHPVELRSFEVADGCAREHHSADYVACTYNTDAGLSQTINQLIDARVRKEADYEAATRKHQPKSACKGRPWHTAEVSAGCDAPFVLGDVVSIDCKSGWESVHPEFVPWTITFRIDHGAIHELSLRDLLQSDAAEEQLWNLVRADLERQMKEYHSPSDGSAPIDDRFSTSEEIEDALDRAENELKSVTLTRNGLRFSWDQHPFGYSILDSTIPYGRLEGMLVPDLLQFSRRSR